MAKKVYILNHGVFYNSRSVPIATVFTKKDAASMCREHGYSWNSYEQIFMNEESKSWIRVDMLEANKFFTGDCVSFGMTKEQKGD